MDAARNIDIADDLAIDEIDNRNGRRRRKVENIGEALISGQLEGAPFRQRLRALGAGENNLAGR